MVSAYRKGLLRKKKNLSLQFFVFPSSIFFILVFSSVPWGFLDEVLSREKEDQGVRALMAAGHRRSAVVQGLRPYAEYKARISAENRLGRGKPGQEVKVRIKLSSSCDMRFNTIFLFSVSNFGIETRI